MSQEIALFTETYCIVLLAALMPISAVRFNRSDLVADIDCFGGTTLLGVKFALLRNNGTVGRRLNAVEAASGGAKEGVAADVVFRGRNGL